MQTLISIIRIVMGAVLKAVLPLILGKCREHKKITPIGNDKELQEAVNDSIIKELEDSLPGVFKFDGNFSGKKN